MPVKKKDVHMPKILIVDDKESNLVALETVLKCFDVEIVKALGGDEALRATLNNEFALAILDVQMPGMDGYELASLLRGEECEQIIPIILLSAVYSDEFHVFKGYEYGAVDFVTKPFNPEVLISKVTVFLELYQQRAELAKRKNELEKLVERLEKEIFERKKAEEEKARLESQLRRAQKMESVGRLAGGVAHDFNNMLGIILGHTEMAMEEIDQEHKLFADFEEIRKAALRSADLTRQLLAYARKQTVSPKVLDLNETVEGMLTMLRSLIGEDIDLAWLPDNNLWPVKVDPSQIDQILANLCVNARDAIEGAGKITIETGTAVFDKDHCSRYPGFVPGEFVMFAVSDNGSGMNKETMDNIFEPFFTTKGVGEGTGLGLATVYGIVKQNNGFINVYSEPGRGTTFKIYLPRAEKQAAEKPLVDLKKDLRGKETVLMVEDEEPLLALGRTILLRHGYEVLAAKSPAEALGIVESYPGSIHLLITDVVMPGMNGKDLRDRLAEVKPGFKSVFMSGYTANVIAHHGIVEEGVDFLQKPFSVQALLEKVRNVLDG